jgi:hypothetical protein
MVSWISAITTVAGLVPGLAGNKFSLYTSTSTDNSTHVSNMPQLVITLLFVVVVVFFALGAVIRQQEQHLKQQQEQARINDESRERTEHRFFVLCAMKIASSPIFSSFAKRARVEEFKES